MQGMFMSLCFCIYTHTMLNPSKVKGTACVINNHKSLKTIRFVRILSYYIFLGI